MKILVIGKNGQLGKSIKQLIVTNENANNDEYSFIGREELDLSDKRNLKNYFLHRSFDVIVNCAAYTQVDRAEEEIKLANQVNNIAVAELSKISKNNDSKFIHISTDYVFDGNNPNNYKEDDHAKPINVYGKTKLSGECAVQAIMKFNATIIRTSWLFSEYGSNFVDTMLRLGSKKDELSIVCDQFGSPTYALDLAKAIISIIQNQKFIRNHKTQIYHYTSNDSCSWNEFAIEIFKLSKIDCNVKKINSKDYPIAALRPRNTVLSNSKITRTFGLKPQNWRESLKLMLANH